MTANRTAKERAREIVDTIDYYDGEPGLEARIAAAIAAAVEAEREAAEERFDKWIRRLDEDVIQGEFGYEPGEFTVFRDHWRGLYDEGLSPREAWQRALDGHADARREEDALLEAVRARKGGSHAR